MSDEATHQRELLQWRTEREDSLRRENGWLALAGLHWLRPGRNRCGSAPGNEIVLPRGAPALIGSFDVGAEGVRWECGTDVAVRVSRQAANGAFLQNDTGVDPSYISVGEIRMVVIERGGRVGIRVWDNSRAERRSHPPRSWFDPTTAWRVRAAYTALAIAGVVVMPDASGTESTLRLDTSISFVLNGVEYHLDATREQDESLFVRFRDQTSQDRTYPSGRYLTCGTDMQARGVLDFNYAYNPPCAFTDFATCIFAPTQNTLELRIEAGETYSRH